MKMDLTITAPYLAHFLDFAKILGFKSHLIEADFQKEGVDLCSFEQKISLSQYLKVVDEIQKDSKEGDLGLRYGMYLKIKALGVIYEVSLHAESIHQGLLLLEDYLQVNYPIFKIQLDHFEDNCRLSLISSNTLSSPQKMVLSDSLICFIFREMELMLGMAKSVVKLYVPVSRYALFSNYFSEVGISEKTFIEFPLEFLEKKLAKHHISRLASLLPTYLQLIENNDRGFSFSVRKMILNMCCPGLPTYTEVLQQFAMSKRSFQRQLSREQSSFRKICNSIRKELSYYLESSSLPTHEIAYLLGYSSASAYLHARKRWRDQKA